MNGMEALRNIIRVGTVSSVNYAAGKVRVAFRDKDGIVSNELPMLRYEYKMPAVGETVLCLFLPNGLSRGFCLGTFYSANNMPAAPGEGIYFKDLLGEGFIKYDKSTGTLTIKTDNVAIEGNVSITGNLDVNGSISASNLP